MRFLRTFRYYIVALLLLSIGLAATAWWQRTPLLCWYYVNGLEAATDADRKSWVNSIVDLDYAAVPGLLNRLAAEDSRVCKNIQAALMAMARNWGPEDNRTLKIADKVSADFATFSEKGKESVLEWQLAVIQPSKSNTALNERAAALLKVAASSTEKGVRRRTLALANELVGRDPTPECLAIAKQLVKREINDNDAELRAEAIHLTLHSVFQSDLALLKEVAHSLTDKNPQVRRAALLAVGSARKIIHEEQLLPLLHDDDAEVRRLCAVALRSRGLSSEQILLGRLISDRRASKRLTIVNHLPNAQGIDPAPWLQRLSQDPSDAVRAAAVRLASSSANVSFQRRMQELAQNDRSETVRQLANHYLAELRIRSSENGIGR